MMVLTVQIKSVFISLAAGLLVGIFFDLYRLFRGFKSPNKFLTFFEDLLFWILSAILIFLFLLYTNYAYVGFYVYLFIGLGLYFYFIFISKLFINLQYTFVKSIAKVFRIFAKYIFYPIRIIFHKKKRKKS